MVATMKIEFESYSLCLLICLRTIKVDFKVDSRKNLKMDFVKADFKILIRSEINFKLTEIRLSPKLNLKSEIRKSETEIKNEKNQNDLFRT